MSEKKTITKICFSPNFILAYDDKGNQYSQSLDWYPGLKQASDEQRANYKFGLTGIHWRELDEDISFESFVNSNELKDFLIEKQSRLNELFKEQHKLLKLTEECRDRRDWGQLELNYDHLDFLNAEIDKIIEELENELGDIEEN